VAAAHLKLGGGGAPEGWRRRGAPDQQQLPAFHQGAQEAGAEDQDQGAKPQVLCSLPRSPLLSFLLSASSPAASAFHQVAQEARAQEAGAQD